MAFVIAAILTAVVVLLGGAALQPAPPKRNPGTSERDRGLGSGPTSTDAGAERHPIGGRLQRRPEVGPADVGAWCESLARTVRSGATLVAALDTTPPPSAITPVVDQIRLRVHRGERLAHALDTTTASADANLALNVLRACAINGGPPAEPLDRAAAVLRGRAADADERRTHSAQARMSAAVMTVLPVAMLTLLLVTSASTRAAVVTPIGLTLVLAGAALNAVGWWWSRQIIAGASR